MTNEQILQKFLVALEKAHGLSPMTVRAYRQKLTPLFDQWKNTPLAEWNYGMWEDLISDNDWAPGTKLKLWCQCRKLRQWCEDRGIPCGDFLKSWTPPQQIRKKPKVATLDQVRALLKWSRGRRLELCIALAAHAALRRNEVQTLRWQDVDFEGRKLTVFSPKTKKTRYVDVNSVLMEILMRHHQEEGRPTAPEDQVINWKSFAESSGNGQRELTRLQADINCPQFGFHALRHFAATQLLNNNVTVAEVRDILGHGNISTTDLYVHSTPKNLAAAMETLAS